MWEHFCRWPVGAPGAPSIRWPPTAPAVTASARRRSAQAEIQAAQASSNMSRIEDALYVAVDLGAGSGRVMLGGVAPGELLLEEVHRFSCPAAHRAGHLRWD